jgi:phage terminase large subunit
LYRQIDDSDKWPIIADSSRPETISYLRRHGFDKVYSSVKGKDSIKEGVDFLKSYEIIVHPRCKYTIDELTNYRWKVDEKIVDPTTGRPVVLPVLVDDKNHIIDPLRYAHEGHRRAEKSKKKKQSFIPQPTRNPMARA